MDLPSYFADFLSDIRLTKDQLEDCRVGHRTLRRRLNEDPDLSPVIISTFLQGSYRRATAVRPKGGKRAGVDVVVVTNLDRNDLTPAQALDMFADFCEKHYKGKYNVQGRSIAIELSYVDLDLVPTAAPAEDQKRFLTKASVLAEETPDDVNDWRLVDSWVPLEKRTEPGASFRLEQATGEAEWKLAPLWIPDRDVERWVETHPIEQIRWTFQKNKVCSGHYVNVVKSLKWWRRINNDPPYPKGYPLEHLIGQHCPDGIGGVAEGIVKSLEAVVSTYRSTVESGNKPELSDHGVPSHDVFKRITSEDFAAFYKLIEKAAGLAREALDADTVSKSAGKWRELFGEKFPPPPDDNRDAGSAKSDSSGGGFTPRIEPSVPTGRRFA